MREKNNSRVLIINVHSTRNGGDRALLEAVIHQLKEASKNNINISVVANWPTEEYFNNQNINVLASPWWIIGCGRNVRVYIQILRLLLGILQSFLPLDMVRNEWNSLFRAFYSSDLVVTVSGNIFYSTGRWGWPFPVHAVLVWLAHRFRKPLFVMPQSIGPLRRGWERFILRYLYNQAKIVLLRDQHSIELSNEISFGKARVQYQPDPGFTYKPADRQFCQHLLAIYGFKLNMPAIGLTVIAPMGRSLVEKEVENYYKVLACAVSTFAKKHHVQVFLFSQVTGPTIVEDDRIATYRVAQMINDSGLQVYAITDPLAPDILKGCYGLMDLFIASRLHSGIFSLGMNVPTLFIGYLSKTEGVLRSLGLMEYFLDLRNINEDDLYTKIETMWTNRKMIAERLKGLIPLVRTKANCSGKLIWEAFTSEKEA